MPTTSWRDNVAQQDQDDLDELLDICLDNATTQLSNSGTMRPFAATVDTAGEKSLIAHGDDSVTDSNTICADLITRLRGRRDRLRATGLTFGVRLDDGQSAIRVNLEHGTTISMAVDMPFTTRWNGKLKATGDLSLAAAAPNVWSDEPVD